jgi:hypothetical protein
MALIDDLTTELATWKAAQNAILTSAQSYSIAGRSLTRADLATIKDKVSELEARIARISQGRVTSPNFLTLRG